MEEQDFMKVDATSKQIKAGVVTPKLDFSEPIMVVRNGTHYFNTRPFYPSETGLLANIRKDFVILAHWKLNPLAAHLCHSIRVKTRIGNIFSHLNILAPNDGAWQFYYEQGVNGLLYALGGGTVIFLLDEHFLQTKECMKLLFTARFLDKSTCGYGKMELFYVCNDVPQIPECALLHILGYNKSDMHIPIISAATMSFCSDIIVEYLKCETSRTYPHGADFKESLRNIVETRFDVLTATQPLLVEQNGAKVINGKLDMLLETVKLSTIIINLMQNENSNDLMDLIEKAEYELHVISMDNNIDLCIRAIYGTAANKMSKMVNKWCGHWRKTMIKKDTASLWDGTYFVTMLNLDVFLDKFYNINSL